MAISHHLKKVCSKCRVLLDLSLNLCLILPSIVLSMTNFERCATQYVTYLKLAFLLTWWLNSCNTLQRIKIKKCPDYAIFPSLLSLPPSSTQIPAFSLSHAPTGLTFNNCTFCPHCIYVFCIYLRTNSDLCHLQHKLIGFYNRDEKCLQRGTNWVFK